MPNDDPIDLVVLDDKEVKKFQEKQKRIQRVLDTIHENGLDKDKEFMEQIDVLIEALIEEKD